MMYLLAAFISINAYATSSQDAANAAARAFYEYEHWNDDVNRFLQQYEKRLTPMEKKIGGYLYQVANIINRREIRVTWTF
jgi:hypothetical protein